MSVSTICRPGATFATYPEVLTEVLGIAYRESPPSSPTVPDFAGVPPLRFNDLLFVPRLWQDG